MNFKVGIFRVLQISIPKKRWSKPSFQINKRSGTFWLAKQFSFSTASSPNGGLHSSTLHCEELTEKSIFKFTLNCFIRKYTFYKGDTPNFGAVSRSGAKVVMSKWQTAKAKIKIRFLTLRISCLLATKRLSIKPFKIRRNLWQKWFEF